MRLMSKTLVVMLMTVATSVGCETPPPPATPPLPHSPPAAASTSTAPLPTDPLGTRPIPARPAAYVPPVPKVLSLKSGMTVWLLERHTLPLVSMTLVVPGGSAQDPKGKEGLASFTANMLDEGAGKRGALELARTFEALGAQVKTGALADYSFAQLTVLRRNVTPALSAYVDVVARPTFAQTDFARVKELWSNDLRARRADPADVARVAGLVLHYGVDHPYGHPTEGMPKGAASVTLADVKESYARAYRADTATLVVVGDMTEEDVLQSVGPAFEAFPKGKGDKPKPIALPEVGKKRRIVIVDRPDAPQSVVALLLPSLSGGDADAPLLSRANVALGGSFTSRLNQDLREERGITYGATSRLSFSRGAGLFIAQASVETAKTGEAVKALLADVRTYAKDGPTEEESEKTRLVGRADLVEAYEGVAASSARLARLAGIGLPASHEAGTAKTRDEAGRAVLAEITKKWLNPEEGAVLVVGPKAKVVPQLEAIGLGVTETLTVD